MKGFFAFIKSKQFFIHLGIALLLLAISIWVLIRSLNSYTQHGDSIEVPDFKGKAIRDLDQFINDKEIKYLIIDSIYAPKEKPGVVIRQDPESKSKVKRNRTIYLYVTGMQPPQLPMPKIIDRSERQAISMLASYGLKVGKITEIAGDCNGCVLGQFYKGQHIEPGTLINKGSVIDISIGKKDKFSMNTDTVSVGNETNFE